MNSSMKIEVFNQHQKMSFREASLHDHSFVSPATHMISILRDSFRNRKSESSQIKDDFFYRFHSLFRTYPLSYFCVGLVISYRMFHSMRYAVLYLCYKLCHQFSSFTSSAHVFSDRLQNIGSRSTFC